MRSLYASAIIAMVALGSVHSTSLHAAELNGEGKEIVVFMPTRGDAYLAQWARGAEEAAAESNYKLSFIENNYDPTEQDAQAQQRLSMPNQPAAYAWWPSDNKAGLATLRRLSRTGVPVIQVNQEPLPEGKDLVAAYVGVDNYGLGQQSGRSMLKAREAFVASGGTLSSNGGNLVILKFAPGYAAGEDRASGFLEAVGGQPFNVVASESAGFDKVSGYKVMSQLLPKLRGDGIQFVYGANDAVALGAIQAMREGGLTAGKDVFVVGSNCISDITGATGGTIFATSLQSAALEGYFAVNTIARYLASDRTVEPGKYNAPADADAQPVFPERISEMNFIPTPPLVTGEDPAKAEEAIANFKLWGKTYTDHCVY